VIELEGSSNGQDSSQGLMLFSTEPNLSQNGNYLAFTSSISAFYPRDDNEAPDIYVLNLKSDVIKRASISSAGIEGNRASYSPGISADGRYVVFSSIASNLVKDDLNTCTWYGAEISCMDIFIHDMETEHTLRVSTAEDGTEADNNSYYPKISADGRWVVYWSEASNLTEGSRGICGEGYEARNCLSIYIYDRVNQSTKMIPIGRQYSLVDIEPVSISGDGRFIGLTILSRDKIAERLNLTNSSEAFIYDNQLDTFTSVNLNNEGSKGNAESFHPRISTDGRYVAFASMADNLTPDDSNGKSGVFLHDFINKTTTLISISQDGSRGNAESGTRTIPGIAGWGEQISISDDGRFIVFTSHADNLDVKRVSSCAHLVKSVCVNVYLHDRVKRQTSLIMPGRGLYSFYINIKISGDGRWIAIVEQFIRCTDKDICSQLWLYDSETERVELPLRNQVQFPGERSNWPHLSFGQGSKVNAITLSPDTSIIATGANDSTIKMWDVNGAPLNVIFGHRLPVSDVEFVQDGSHIISSSRDGTVIVWDPHTGVKIHELLQHNSAILGLALSRDGSQLAAGGVGGTWFWNKNEELFSLAGSIPHPGIYVSDLAFSPDGAHLAMAMSDGTVWIKDMFNLKTVLRLGGHQGRVLDVDFSPDGHFLASGSEDQTLNLWNLSAPDGESLNAQHIASVKHPNWVNSVNFSNDGNLLASVALGDKVYLWDMTQRQPLKLLLRISHDEVMSLGFSADTQIVAAGTIGGNIHLWHLMDLDMEP
jgi:WD40 repeat protein